MNVFTQEQVRRIFEDLGEALEQDARNETQQTTAAALYAVAHRVKCIDWQWYLSPQFEIAMQDETRTVS